MSVKKWWDKILVTLGYIFIGILSAMIGFFVLRKKKVDYESMEPGDIVDSLPNADAVRERINDFGTASRANGGSNSGDVSAGGNVDSDDTRRRGVGVLTGWMESVKRVGVGGTHPVLRVSGGGGDKGADEGDRKTKKAT